MCPIYLKHTSGSSRPQSRETDKLKGMLLPVSLSHPDMRLILHSYVREATTTDYMLIESIRLMYPPSIDSYVFLKW